MDIRDETTEQLAPERPSNPNLPLIGRKLGKFTLVGELGKGGSGEVFRAEERELGRTVVVKVLRRDVARKTNRVERFLREVKLASRLDHPYAAHVYAFGAESDGVVWIAMEHVKGMTLDSLVATRGAMPPTLFAPLFERLCEVVHTAHEMGIVHRDIKGSNVMVVERAGRLLPKLLDFGIAKGIAGDVSPGSDDDDLTGHGAILGSPHYMAPEQWASAGDVDARADIYALGALAYFCLAGAVPFAGTDRRGLPQAHREQKPPPLPRSIPEAAAQAIERALAKSPDARWQSALAFGEAIRDAVGVRATEPVPLVDPATRDKWIERGPQPIADAVARLSRATTTVEADAALYELVAIVCRWCATVALAQLREPARAGVREQARAVVGRDDAMPWLALARAAAAAAAPTGLDRLAEVLAATTALEKIATRLDDRDRARTAAALAADVAALPEALAPLELLLDYHLVVGRGDSAESWQGLRRRDRERVVVWGEPLADGDVALLDPLSRIATRLSPLVQVSAPLPSAEPELFLLWRTGRGGVRLVAAPWGYERDDEEAARWLAVMTTDDSVTPTHEEDDRSPYPGLAAYEAGDASHFVGREREVDALLNRLVAAPLVAVLGASGAGKTSFVHAGVIPRLDGYEILSLRPGRHPLRALSAEVLATEDTSLDDEALVAELRARGDKAMRGLVIVIDQFEELVTLCSDADERHRFAAVLSRTAGPVRVVVTLRDDFANVVETLAPLRGRFELFVLATPAPDALRRIITEPARRAQVTIDPRVVDDMVREVEGHAGSLPLLSFTGAQLWESRDRQARKITHEAYVALGGVAGALSTYADQVYDSFAAREQDRVRVLFSRLVAADGTRIPIPRAELEALPGALAVLPQLIDARLLVVREDAGVDVVEIVHECLAMRWDRLARWRSEDAAERALLADLRVAARRWTASKRDPDLLWRGEALGELRKLAAHSGALTGTERAFAHESDRVVRRTRRMRRTFAAAAMIVLAGVAITMGYLRTVADSNRKQAERSADNARTAAKLAEDRLTASLLAQGKRELNTGKGIAALAYFHEVLQRGYDTPGLRFMIGVAGRALPHEIFVHVRGGYTASVLLADGFAAVDHDGKLRFWSEDAKPLGEVALDVAPVSKLVRQGDRLIAIGSDGVAIVDAKQRKQLHRIALDTDIKDAQLGPAPDELAVVGQMTAIVYGLDGKERRRTELPPGGYADFARDAAALLHSVNGVAYVIDTRTWARKKVGEGVRYRHTLCADRKTWVYPTLGREVHVLETSGARVAAFRPKIEPLLAVCSETGDRIGAVTSGEVEVFDRKGTPLRAVYYTDRDSEGGPALVGDETWTGSLDGTLRRYDENLLIASLPSHTGRLQEIRVSPKLVLTRSEDSTLVVMRASAKHIELADTACLPEQLDVADAAIGLICGDTEHVYVGNHVVASMVNEPARHVAYEPVSQRAAMVSHQLRVYERGKLATKGPERVGLLAFADRDRVILAEYDPPASGGKPGLWRWSFAADKWERLQDLEPGATALTVAGDTIAIANGKRLIYAGARSATVEQREPIVALASTSTIVAAQLASGRMILLDSNGRTLRELAPVDASGLSPALDAAGTLLIRPQRNSVSVWDPKTGEQLLDKLDLLRFALNARFAVDGSGIEFAGTAFGKIAVVADTRPREQLLEALACRVPLRIAAGGGLEARDVKCD